MTGVPVLVVLRHVVLPGGPRVADESSCRRGCELRRLIEEGVHLCQNGERAPGGDETWPKWARKAEDWLRRDLCHQYGHDGGCPDCRVSENTPGAVDQQATAAASRQTGGA